MRLCVLIIFNLMTRVVEINVLHGKLRKLNIIISTKRRINMLDVKVEFDFLFRRGRPNLYYQTNEKRNLNNIPKFQTIS